MLFKSPTSKVFAHCSRFGHLGTARGYIGDRIGDVPTGDLGPELYAQRPTCVPRRVPRSVPKLLGTCDVMSVVERVSSARRERPGPCGVRAVRAAPRCEATESGRWKESSASTRLTESGEDCLVFLTDLGVLRGEFADLLPSVMHGGVITTSEAATDLVE